MKPKPKAPLPKPYSENEIVRLVWLAIFISVFSFLFYNRQGAVLLYGDAVAHINIARRVFDSRTPGLLQLGTVWLPLPHLLILPFVVSKPMWQSGAGGSVPSMIAFVLGALGIFRLVRTALQGGEEMGSVARIAPWSAAILYAANPNLIYMQATAMGEALYLALSIWSLVFFVEFIHGKEKSLARGGLCLLAACLTRYDGWFLAAVLVICALFFGFSARKTPAQKPVQSSRKALLKLFLLATAGPVLWLVYNAAVYRNPLEFANGPYSAKSIEQKTATVNPAKGNLVVSAAYFVSAAELNVANSNWAGHLWLALALGGTITTWLKRRGRILLLLWTPLPFYALSIAYGSIPIFVPTQWPFSQYNVRYGLQLLPPLVVFASLGICFLVQFALRHSFVSPAWRRRPELVMVIMMLLVAAPTDAAIWRADPICFREADLNMKGSIALDRQVGEWIKSLPPSSTLLMYLGQHVGALERAGIPLQRTINEGNHRVWMQTSDPDGLWERALSDPASFADYAIGFEGDPVWKAARDRHLTALVEIHATGQASAVIFQGRSHPSPQPEPR